jgi:hypothetical protein
MFNSMRTDELIAGIGQTVRAAASASGPPDDYARGQLLSAYSVSRLLAAEVKAEAELYAWLRSEVLGALAAAAGDPAVAAARPRAETAADGVALGAVLVDLLAELRLRDPEPELRRRLHSILREMAERELVALAARPERREAQPG